jgi:adenylosuccinate lyase
MLANLNATRGLVFSGQLLLDLTEAGMLREKAYQLVQAHAMQCWSDGSDFRAAVQGDQDILKYLSLEKLTDTFSSHRQLANVPEIFARVFD